MTTPAAAIKLWENVRPRVLVQSGCYELDNLGDQSMLKAAIDRMRERLPYAQFTVVSRSIERLKSIAPDARTLSVENRREWQWVRSGYIAFRKGVPVVDPFVRRHFPRAFGRLLRLKASRLSNAPALDETDFMLLSGGGYFTEVFAGQAWSSLERIKAAKQKRVPFALVGHGVGPLRDPDLLDAARDLLPHARLIGVREGLRTIPILESLGVSKENIVVTGDDSVEHAWRLRKSELGNALGVNLRIAPYAGTTDKDIDVIHSAMKVIASHTRCDVIPLPVCVVKSVESASDVDVALRIVSGLPKVRIDETPNTVEELIERISQCRVAVTGSYHGAVFALSQGIPAVCIYSSEYYRGKFEGLADQFGRGCVVLSRSDRSFPTILRDTVIATWNDADALRPRLLDAAARQVRAGHRAYDRLAAVIARDSGAPGSSRPELVA